MKVPVRTIGEVTTHEQRRGLRRLAVAALVIAGTLISLRIAGFTLQPLLWWLTGEPLAAAGAVVVIGVLAGRGLRWWAEHGENRPVPPAGRH